MKKFNQVQHSERRGHLTFAKIFFPVLAALGIIYIGTFARGVSNVKADAAKATNQAKELVASAATQLGPNLEWTVFGTKVGQ
jgi:hypothetical protein